MITKNDILVGIWTCNKYSWRLKILEQTWLRHINSDNVRIFSDVEGSNLIYTSRDKYRTSLDAHNIDCLLKQQFIYPEFMSNKYKIYVMLDDDVYFNINRMVQIYNQLNLEQCQTLYGGNILNHLNHLPFLSKGFITGAYGIHMNMKFMEDIYKDIGYQFFNRKYRSFSNSQIRQHDDVRVGFLAGKLNIQPIQIIHPIKREHSMSLNELENYCKIQNPGVYHFIDSELLPWTIDKQKQILKRMYFIDKWVN